MAVGFRVSSYPLLPLAARAVNAETNVLTRRDPENVMTVDFVIQHTWLSRPAAPLRRMCEMRAAPRPWSLRGSGGSKACAGRIETDRVDRDVVRV